MRVLLFGPGYAKEEASKENIWPIKNNLSA
jgi:hypothetical protein